MKEHHVSEECRPLIGYGKLMPPLSGGHSTLSSSFWHAYTNNIKSMLGIGLFTMPFLTAKAGLALAIFVLCLFAYINYECTRMLVLCASHENQRVGTMLVGNWKHLSYQAFGELGVFVTVTTVLGAQIGVCTSYFDELTRTFVQEGQMRRSVVLPLLWMSLSAVSMLITPGMRAFAWVSAAAMAALIYDAILLGFFALAHEKPYDANHLKLWDISGLPAFLGPAVFAFECAPTALNIYSSMGQIDGSAYMRVSGYAYSTGLLFILLICVLGYAGFGPDVRRVVLFSFPRTPLGLSAQWVINVVLFLSFNLQLLPAFTLLESFLLPGLRSCLLKQGDLVGRVADTTARFAVRSLVVGAVVLFGAALPDVETVVGLSGAIFMTMSIAILPPAFYLKLRPDGGNQYLDTFACAIIPIGLCVMFAGVVGQVDIIKQ